MKSEDRPLLRVEGQNVYICYRSFKYNFNYERNTADIVYAFNQVLQVFPKYALRMVRGLPWAMGHNMFHVTQVHRAL